MTAQAGGAIPFPPRTTPTHGAADRRDPRRAAQASTATATTWDVALDLVVTEREIVVPRRPAAGARQENPS